MQPEILKYILDLESVIREIEEIKVRTQNDFDRFLADIVLQRAIERDLEIIGEAVRKILDLQPNFPITSARNIIGLRNIISHAYDTVEPELIWAIIQKDIPVLSENLKRIRQK